jgi:hypothetical protein
MGTATLIHLEPGQKEKLARLARKRRSSVSGEVRNAVRFYLQLPLESEKEWAALAAEARKATENMLVQLEGTLAALRRSRKRWEKR